MTNQGRDAAVRDREGDRAGRAGCAVLYVEDDPLNATLFAALAARVPGLRLHVARSGAEALALAGTLAPDLLLLDHGLPDTDGGALLGRLRDECGLVGVPAILLSALSPDEAQACVRAAGFDGCWSKPIDVSSTLSHLARLAPAPA